MNQTSLSTLLQVPKVEPDLGFDISPNGRQIAFSWNPTGAWEIYLQPLDNSSEPRQLTSGPGSKFAPRWSPDGERLLYAVDLFGGEKYNLFLYDVASDTHTNLTPDSPYYIRAQASWSPNGDKIALISDQTGCFDTYVAPVSSRPARQVLSLPYPDWQVRWSPDGLWLLIISETQGQDFGAFITPVNGGDPRQIMLDGKSICVKDSCWSPDSKHIVFASNPYDYYNIGTYELDTGRITWLTKGEGDKEYPVWSPDGRRIAYVHSNGPVTSLAVLELDRESSRTYQVAPGVHYRPQFTPDSAQLVCNFDNPAHPNDLWSLSLETGAFRQITHSLPAELKPEMFTMPQQVRYPGLDGVRVPALLYQPARTQVPPPAVIHIHGGPNWLAQVTWNPMIQHMVSRGWVVLQPNYRGSTGYGREWQTANRFDLGGVGAGDVVAGGEFLTVQHIARSDRIALTGKSWGGYLTMLILTQYPDRWAAGSAVVPFLNWFTGHANSREDLQHWDRENFGDPEEDYDLWYERSPFFFLDRIVTP
ncbi:MAG: S9 family peptidase, partial [Anaerolineales bacterium]|nr:S9 family peptidase [Anaerolineales bacterium]